MSPDTCRRVYLAQIDAMHKTPDRPSRKHTYAAMSEMDPENWTVG